MDDLIIGIDLGTTNSCVSLYTNGRIKILENESGLRITPSFIYVSPNGEIAIGEHGKKMSKHKPENGIYEMKRLVGRQFDDPQLQESLKYFPFKVIASRSNFPLISVKQRTGRVKKSPQELYTMLLKELKKYTEEKLKQTINKAVITVPAYFNVTQRQVTLEAAKDAGFTVLKLLNEPTAAALAYYFDNDIEGTHRSLVYDLGGGTFDVAVLEKRFEKIEVLCVAGDTQLGGHDIDTSLLNYVYRILRTQYGYDPAADPDDKKRLRIKCEEAKKELSTLTETVIFINGLVPKYPRIKISLTRKKFEEMADKLFRRTIAILDKCLQFSNISKRSIQEIILCGGSTRIPKIQKLISDYFEGKELNKFVNPDECVAEGAALQAAMLSTNRKQKIDELQMVDVVPLSIGTRGHSCCDDMVFLIKRGSKLPTSASQTYINIETDETTFSFDIYEGERLDIRKNRHLGTVSLTNVEKAPPLQKQVIFTLFIDQNGILTAQATEKFRDNTKTVNVNYTCGDRSDGEIRNSVLDAAENKKHDGKFIRFIQFKKYLIQYCIGIMYNLNEKSLKSKYKDLYNFCKVTKKTAETLEMDDEVHTKELIAECEQRCKYIVKTYNFDCMPRDYGHLLFS
ncbi:heat shock 70 kDa protein-like [Zophobas morio]|uniref:heat shock 70 kDa protein-like n=1 Tax=Zophobas morio TaxID=2755281 RepID=UPI003083C876